MRRGVLSLRVVLKMLTWPHGSYTCGNDIKLLSADPVPASVMQRYSSVVKVMWEMQQLGRRAGALDVLWMLA